MKKPPEISVVILCYKSGDFARVFYKRVTDVLLRHMLDYEIVLVGNYVSETSDSTPRIIKEIASSDNPRTKVVTKEKPSLKHAMGWDMRCGLNASTGNTIAVIDGDGQMQPEDIPTLFYKLTNEKFNLCKTRRTSRGDGLYRIFISFIFNGIMKLLFPGIISKDINSKPKIFTRKTLNLLQLQSNDWFIDGEIMIKAQRHKLKIGEIDTTFDKNLERKSFVSFKTNFEFIKNILSWRIKELKVWIKK
jgi:glycosyltransferase involved in cell wall biosynthesis